MRAIFPGRPRASLQAVCTAPWEGRQIVAYISGNSIIILDAPQSLLQTICQDEVDALDAIAIDTVTGKIVTSSAGIVFIYKPYGLDQGYLKWSQQCSFEAFKEGEATSPCTLSWGMPGELLVGSSSLRLYHITDGESLLWNRTLPRNVQLASFSHDADLIASVGQYDSLVKVWRRLSSGLEDNTFDFSYLSHPAVVTDLFWRRPEKRHSQGGHHVLYTVCADDKLRIWTSIDHHGLQPLQLWGELDLREVIQPRHLSPDSQSEQRFAFVIHGDDFDMATKAALSAPDADPTKRPFLEHLSEIASHKPDVCVVLDGKGHMSAWGLQNIGSKRRKESDVFNIALVENFNLLHSNANGQLPNRLRLLNFWRSSANNSFSVLVHYLDGAISWCDGRMDEYFDPGPNPRRLRLQASWTAHEKSIKKLTRNASGLALISRSNQSEALVWQSRSKRHPASLRPISSIDLATEVVGLCILDQGNHFVSLQHGKVCLWKSEEAAAKQVACCSYNLSDEPVALVRVPSGSWVTGNRYVAVISSLKGVVYEVKLPKAADTAAKTNGTHECLIEQFCVFELPKGPESFVFGAIDPVGHISTMPEFLDVFAPDIALTTTANGIIRTFAARLDVENHAIAWIETAKVDTGIINPSLTAGNSSRKVAVVDESGTGLSIWDTKAGDLEFEQSYGVGEEIRDLDWTATPGSQSLLAVGFPHKVIVFGQMRYNYLVPDPAWAAIREVYTRDLTPHPIGDSTWLGNGSLVIGVGNQLLVYDDVVLGQDRTVKDIPIATHVTSPARLFERVNLLNGPLPLFHPQFLTQLVLAGRLGQVQGIIIALHKTLKFYTEGDELDSNLGLRVESFSEESSEATSHVHQSSTPKVNGHVNDEELETVTEELASVLTEKLAKTALPHISSQEQFYLANMVESIAMTEKQRRSVDTNAARFITFFRQHMLVKASEHLVQAGITWREYAWAFHSGSQDILVDMVSRQFQGKLLWQHARESGLFMWLTDPAALAAQFEVIARNEYTKTDERDPVDCSLYYLALRKKNVLIGLWRMASWHKERTGTQKLLSNNFAETRWKTAALKNAYALLGRRRFEYAAAFFLLADHLKDAVNVCANQLKDLQLAIAIARVHGGDNGPVLRELLHDHVLPQAAQSGDRWQAMWAFWMLGKRDMAVRALITPIWTLLDSTTTPSQRARSFLSNDPALVIMYRQLREKTLQTLKGATQVSPREEWEFILRTARLYTRMGCDHLALELVRNWSFLKLPAVQSSSSVPDPRKLLRRRSSLVVDDITVPSSSTAPAKAGGKGPKPPPTMFEEPAASSLLDQFGF